MLTRSRKIWDVIDHRATDEALFLDRRRLLAGMGLGIAAYALVGFFTGHVNTGWTSLALMVVTFGIAQLVCLGIIGAYVGRTYMQVKGRPLFMIDQVASHREAGHGPG